MGDRTAAARETRATDRALDPAPETRPAPETHAPETRAAPDTRRAHWDGVYAARRADELSWFEAFPATSLTLIERCRPGKAARIVDVGGGASRLTGALLDAGYQSLTVLDLSAVALAAARERLGPRASAVEWLAADVTTWRPPAAYGIWHDRAVFHFLTGEEDRAGYRAALEGALQRGGHAVIGTFAEGGPAQCSGLPVVRYEPAALAAALGPAFALVESLHEDHLTPSGKVQRFQFSRLVKL